MIDLAALKRAAERATKGPFVLMRYDHGGGRMYQDAPDASAELVADFYGEADREYYARWCVGLARRRG